jgi:coenzyme F420-reducing hydrogenase delta subunit
MLSYLCKVWITAEVDDNKMVNLVREGIQGVVIVGCRR